VNSHGSINGVAFNDMKNYRVTDPIPVMVRDGGAYMSRTLPKGTIVSGDELPTDPNRCVSVNWNGKFALISARHLRLCAEPTSKEIAGYPVI
jgi:hypothetical protein